MRIDRRGTFTVVELRGLLRFARTLRIVTLVILQGYFAGVLRFNAAPVVSTKFYASVYYRADVRYFLLALCARSRSWKLSMHSDCSRMSQGN